MLWLVEKNNPNQFDLIKFGTVNASDLRTFKAKKT